MIHSRETAEPTFLKRNPHLDLLRNIHIFRHLDDTALLELYRRMSVKHWHGGAIVMGQQEPGEALYVLVAGRAKVVLFGDNGREMTLSSLRPGDFFGEMSLFDGKPRSANVVAEKDSTFLVLEREAFMGHLRDNPETAIRLLKEMAGRLRSANEIINNLALHDVTSRLTRTLVSLATEHGEERDEGILIPQRPTQQDLANMVGTCRETVSRALSSMARRGLVVSRGRTLLLSWALLDGAQRAA
jgi:CRP/FNR family cyclic AMP-dependent transcriptional regulator